MKLSALFLVLFIASIVFFSCKNRRPDLVAGIDTESKEFCLFDVGSYWVYQDSATLEIDSIRVEYLTHKTETILDADIPSFGWEEYTMQLSLSKNNEQLTSFLILTSRNCLENNVKKMLFIPIQLISSGSANILGNAAASNYTNYHNGALREEYLGFDNSHYIFFEEKYRSYLVVDSLFEDVKSFVTSVTNPTSIIKTYWAKNVGIIRTEYIRGDTLIVRNLKRYNVKSGRRL